MANSKKYDIERRTSSTDAVPSALQGDLYWYDTGTEVNGESVYYDNATSAYAYWNNGSDWLITVVADVDGSPSDYFVEIPSEITALGAGHAPANTVYPLTGTQNGKAKWDDGTHSIAWDNLNTEWSMSWSTPSAGFYFDATTGNAPSTTGWQVGSATPPAPTLSFSTSSSFVGVGTWSGIMTTSSTVLADAWERAETTAFESLRNFTGCEENDDCFRGFLPVIGDSDDYESTNVWMMTSGSSGDFDNDRLAGSNALWCSLRSDARIESIWENRSDAMKFAGLVEAWLKETGNLEETGNIQWCRMTDIPSEPQVYRTDGKIREQYWIQAIDLELVYSTETTFS